MKGARAILERRDASLSSADRHLVRGRIDLLENRPAAARRELSAAVRSQPGRASHHYWLGRALLADNASAMASSAFQKAYALGLGSCDLHRCWAEALRASGAALGDLRQLRWRDVLDAEPVVGETTPHGLVVQTVRGRGDVIIVAPEKSAIFQAQQALKADPGNAEALLLAGELWAEVDQHRLAVRMFRQAARQLAGEDPQETRLARCHEKWAASSLALGRLDSYLDHTGERARLVGDTEPAAMAPYYEIAAQEASSRGQLERQIKYLTRAAECEQTAVRLVNLADALLVAQRPEEAQLRLKRALALNPPSPERRQIRSRLNRTAFLTDSKAK